MSPRWMDRSVCQNRSYDPSATFAQIIATTIAVTSTAALPASVRRKARTGAARSRGHAVRSRQRDEPSAMGAVVRVGCHAASPAHLKQVGKRL